MNEYRFMLMSLMIVYIYSAVLITNTPLAPTRTTPSPTRTVDTPPYIDEDTSIEGSNTENTQTTANSVIFYRRFFTLMYLSYSAILYTILQTNQRRNIEIFEVFEVV